MANNEEKPKSRLVRDLIISLSLSNLLFFDVWKLFLIRDATFYPYYHWKLNPSSLVVGTIFDVLLVTLIAVSVVTLARRLQNHTVLNMTKIAFLLVFVFVASNFLVILLANPPVGPLVHEIRRTPKSLFNWRGLPTIYSWLSLVVALTAWITITVLIHSLIFRRHKLTKVAVAISLILSPFVVVTFAQAATQWFKYRDSKEFDETTASPIRVNRTETHRVVWIIFDELDFRLSFVDRPNGLLLKEFDKWRSESLFAEHAHSPGIYTELSLPALITGQPISKINRSAPNDLDMRIGARQTQWSAEQNVFSRTRQMGLNSGLAGWYHPYCRIVGKDLNKCYWESTSLLFLPNTPLADLITFGSKVSIPRAMWRIAETAAVPAAVRYLAPKDARTWRDYAAREFTNIHTHAREMVSDRSLQLVFLHYPIPHPPGIYDRHSGFFSLQTTSGYLDNVALADRVMEDLRNQMRRDGVWDQTVVVISSDHMLRANRVWKDHQIWKPAFTKEDPLVINSQPDDRVPFILRFPGATQGSLYEPPFNTVITADLVLAILSGEVTNSDGVRRWLDEHRTNDRTQSEEEAQVNALDVPLNH